MSDKTQIDDRLEALAAQCSGGTECLALEIQEGQVLEIKGAVVERLACSFERLSLRNDRLLSADTDRLKQVAESLSRRLSYLLEPLHPLEIDDEACVVQMRSVPPSREEEGTAYYELVVSRGQIDLCRYRKRPGEPRSLIAATVTREALRRLAQDLSAAAE